MADMLLCDRLEELGMLIDQQHLLYLISNESPMKIDQREKLESYIREYLYVAPHNRKFTFSQTAHVLHWSASNKEKFNGYKAALAWKAIGKYADNLVVQPWRKEFKDLKLYCGFYKHEIDENLSDAEIMFEAMGYCHAGNSTMTITDILDPDRITSVSKDAIIAYVECQILKQIWENLSPYYSFTWLEILEFRENHTGTPDQAVRALRYKRYQRQYEEQLYRRAQYQAAENHTRPEYLYGPNSTAYFNHMHNPGHSYSYPVQSRITNVPHLVSPTCSFLPHIHAFATQHVIKPQDLYPSNSYHMNSHYPPHSMQDSYPPPYHTIHPQQPTVPTAQLIELDSTPMPNTEIMENRRYSEDDIGAKWQEFGKNESSFSSSKAKDDGAGSWAAWDYVYRNLEGQCHKKNSSSRGEAISSKTNSSSRNNTGDSDTKIQGELIEKIRKINICGSNTTKVEGSVKNLVEIESESKSKGKTVREQSQESRGVSPEKVNRGNSPPILINTQSGESEIDAVKEKKVGRQVFELEEDDSKDKWECISCTYLNSTDRQICEMCFKSKEPGDESKPQPSGGQECRNCTLVNERGRNFCVACDEPLKDSPTYI